MPFHWRHVAAVRVGNAKIGALPSAFRSRQGTCPQQPGSRIRRSPPFEAEADRHRRSHPSIRIDGKPYKTLKRHLSGNGLTIEEYRERFGLPRDYPSTAANYSAQRSALAKSLGLGNQR